LTKHFGQSLAHSVATSAADLLFAQVLVDDDCGRRTALIFSFGATCS
jgi:hypothetical protein